MPIRRETWPQKMGADVSVGGRVRREEIGDQMLTRRDLLVRQDIGDYDETVVAKVGYRFDRPA
ncbi:hypothetical protein Acsp02_84770 [Actinoplanes sp. NBRC 103695]|nr:hypothetical protein Acsp02_84770 [Actinoplanes sp. NBRC 103695]